MLDWIEERLIGGDLLKFACIALFICDWECSWFYERRRCSTARDWHGSNVENVEDDGVDSPNPLRYVLSQRILIYFSARSGIVARNDLYLETSETWAISLGAVISIGDEQVRYCGTGQSSLPMQRYCNKCFRRTWIDTSISHQSIPHIIISRGYATFASWPATYRYRSA